MFKETYKVVYFCQYYEQQDVALLSLFLSPPWQCFLPQLLRREYWCGNKTRLEYFTTFTPKRWSLTPKTTSASVGYVELWRSGNFDDTRSALRNPALCKLTKGIDILTPVRVRAKKENLSWRRQTIKTFRVLWVDQGTWSVTRNKQKIWCGKYIFIVWWNTILQEQLTWIV